MAKNKNSVEIKTEYLFETTDIFGKVVRLEKDQYDNHIKIHHPEMDGNIKGMQDSIENPHLVIESKQDKNRWLYVGKSEASTYPLLNIKTVVDHSSKDFGYVVTGLFQKKVNAEKEGKIIYDGREND